MIRIRYDRILNNAPPVPKEKQLRIEGRFIISFLLPFGILFFKKTFIVGFLGHYIVGMVAIVAFASFAMLHLVAGSWFADEPFSLERIICMGFFVALLIALARYPGFVYYHWRTHRRLPHWELCLQSLFFSGMIALVIFIGIEAGNRWPRIM